MLGQIKEQIEELSLDEAEFQNYTLVSTQFRKFDKSKNALIKIELPEDEEEFNSCKETNNLVFEIVIDENDPEICCITKYLLEQKDTPNIPMKFRDFCRIIFNFPEHYLDHEVLSSSWVHLDDDYTGRVDRPIIGIFVYKENHRICLMESVS